MTRNISLRALSLLLCIVILVSSLYGCKKKISVNDIPDYSGSAYVEINGNEPYFTDDEITTEAFERYSELDPLGRCGAAFACIGVEIMPTEPRGEIANVTPTGWEYGGISNNNVYDCVEDGYVYNRCHLIGFQLAGENDNEKNLITGTRYMNIVGMLPFENQIAEYVKSTNNHVMYRVTPIFKGLDYVAQGVLMEALSVEDNGSGISFCIFAYNVQPGITIDYFTGVNVASGQPLPEVDTSEDDRNNQEASNSGSNSSNSSSSDSSGGAEGDPSNYTYLVNTNSKKFHLPGKSCGERISEENRLYFLGTREEAIENGYSPCGICNP